MKSLRTFSLVCCFLVSGFAFSQTNEFLWPLESKYTVSGNYGELRPNHFHAGLDFGTMGRYNAPVYAVKEGYVSRIKISAGGYGKAIYITHPNGKVTLYGHLNKYNAKISAYVKEEQLKQKTYEIEIQPKPDELKVTAGEVIAYSGNSGSSTAPHLHYEIRDELTETPLNPALFYKIEDKVKPEVKYLAIYNLSDTTSPRIFSFNKLTGTNGTYHMKKDTIEIDQAIIGFGISGYDKMIPNGGTNNIYCVEVTYDDILFYKHELDNIPFHDTKYVNEYSELYEKQKFQRLFVSTFYPTGMYKRVANKGRVFLMDGKYHRIGIIMKDEAGNESTLNFTIKSTKVNYFEKPTINGDAFADCREDFLYGKKQLQIYIPANTLYNSTPVIFENTLNTTGKLLILPFSAVLKSTAIVGFEIPKKFKAHKNALIFKSSDEMFLPIVKRDSVFYAVKTFGAFLLDVDSIAPTITSDIPAAKLKVAKSLKAITFKIQDNLSGIETYNLFINNEWALAEYDSKSRRLTYYFDNASPKGMLEFRVEAMDKCKNKTELKVSVKN